MPDPRKPIAYRNRNSDIKSVRVDKQKTKTEISKFESKQHASPTTENEEDGWLTESESESEEEASQLEATGGSSSRSTTTTTTTSHQSERTNPPVTITSSKARAPPWAGKELEPERVALEQWMRHKFGTDDLWPETPKGVPSLAEMRDIMRRNPNASRREIRLGILGQRTGRSFPGADEHVRPRLN